MTPSQILEDGFGRIRDRIGRLCGEVGPAELTFRPEPEANTVAWLIWHTSRQMDAQVMALADREQVWTADGWVDRFDLPFQPEATGYGQTSEEVGQVRADPDLLAGYHDAVHQAVVEYLSAIDGADLDRVIDTDWNPPVTVGIRLMSCIGDGLQHVGQSAYILGIAQRSAGDGDG